MTEITLQTVIIFQSFWKCLYYIRIYDSYLKLITISSNIFVDVIPYITIVSTVLFGFMKISQVIEMGVNDEEDEYKQYSSPIIKLMIQQYKSANG